VQYNFQWDSNKAKQNYNKHNVSFERASEVFLDPFMLSIYDKVHSKSEERWITIGMDSNDVPLVVVHTFDEIDNNNCVIRIISTRKATKKEIKQYKYR